MPLSVEANQEVLRRSRSFGRWRRDLEPILPRRRGPGGVRLVQRPVESGGDEPWLVYPPGGRVIPLGEGGSAMGSGLELVYPQPGGEGQEGGTFPPGGWGSQVDLANLEIYPVSLYGFVNVSDVNGAELGPISGPVLIRWVIFSTSAVLTSNDHDSQWRVDFSSVPGRDTFTFVASSPPTGVSSAQYTLFPYSVDFAGGGDGSDVQRWGWASSRPQPDSEKWYLNNLAVKIPLSSFYVKAYWSNDTGTAEGFQCVLGISPLSSQISNVEGYEVQGAPTY